MRSKKHHRKFRNRPLRIGADLINKEVVDFDTCETLITFGMTTHDWRQRHEDSPAVYRADPFGIHDYSVDYSLNKKRRWMIIEEIVVRIEEVQDPYLNIRVSASIHAVDRSDLADYPEIARDRFPCLEYLSVSREGQRVTHKMSKHGRTRLRNFTHAAQPCRKQDKRRRARYVEQEDWSDRVLDAEENVEHQKLHIHYTVQQHSKRPSLHNKMTQKGSRRHLSNSECEEPKEFKRLKGKIDVENTNQEDDDVTDDSFADIDEDDDDVFCPSTIVDDLSELVVRREKRRRRRKAPIRRFVDEYLPSHFLIPLSEPKADLDESEEALNEYESPSTDLSSSSIPLVSLPSEMFTRLPIASVPNFHLSTRLPCFPPAWEIHQKDSLLVLGKNLLTCVIARQYGDELLLAIVDDCPASHPSRLLLPCLEEIPPDIEVVDGDYCEICCNIMDLRSEDRLAHPFSLSCSHLFCTRCWLSHISESIRSKILPADCLHSSCPCTISFNAVKGLLSSSSVEIYKISTIETMKADGKLISCPECKKLHFTEGALRISCPCGTCLCSHCSSISHHPLGCNVFEQYNSYLKQNGFTSIYSTSAEAPIIRELAKCPKCNALMQRSGGCNLMNCVCGMDFCFRCGSRWTASHYSCTKEEFAKMTMVDVSTARKSPLLAPSLLLKAVEARVVLIDRLKELKRHLRSLPYGKRRAVERAFLQLSLIVEFCLLASRSNNRARVMGEKVRFWLDRFFNTSDKDIAVKGRLLKEFRNTLTDSLIV